MEAAPAEVVTAEAIAAAVAVELEAALVDTEDTVEQVGSELFEKVVGSIDTVDQKANIGSGEAELRLVGWVLGWVPCNMEVVVWLG